MATTKTAARPAGQQQTAEPAAAPKNEIVVAALAAPRLPMIPNIADYGYEKDGKVTPYGEAEWRSLVQSIFPGARSAAAVNLALSYCKSRNLDIFKKVCHIVPIYQNGGWVETIWPGVAEPRITATRTKGYAGLDMPAFGPMIKRTFKGKKKDGSDWKDYECTIEYPEWCQITVYRLVGGQRYAFPGPRCNWVEFYTRYSPRFELPNDRWERAPTQMLEKVAEVAALRRAFPEELGDEPTIDEAGAHNAGHDALDVTEQATVSTAEPRRSDFVGAQPTQATDETQTEQSKPAAPKPEPRKEPPKADAPASAAPKEAQKKDPPAQAQSEGDPRPEPPPPEDPRAVRDRRGNVVQDVDPETGEALPASGKPAPDPKADAEATRQEQLAAAGQLEGPEDDDDIPFDNEPGPAQGTKEYPVDYWLEDRPITFRKWGKAGLFSDWAEPFLAHTNPRGAREFLAYYKSGLEGLKAGNPTMQKMGANITKIAEEKAIEPDDPPV